MAGRFLVLGASFLQKPLITYLESNGFSYSVVSIEEKPDWICKTKYHQCDLSNLTELIVLSKRLCIDHVLTIASDFAVIVGAKISENLGIPHEDISKLSLCTNKLKFKQFLKGNNLSRTTQLDPHQAMIHIENGGKVIIKPSDRSGSRGVRCIDRVEDLHQAHSDAKNESFEEGVIFEIYEDGEEYSIETISHNGMHEILAITKKILVPGTHTEFCHIQSRDLILPDIEKLESLTKTLLKKIDLRQSIGHLEVLYANGNYKIIEFGPRPGGDFITSDLIRLSRGIEVRQILIDLASGCYSGNTSDYYTTQPHKHAGVLFPYSDTTQRFDSFKWSELFKKDLIEDAVFPKKGDWVHKASDSSKRLGFGIWASNDEIPHNPLNSFKVYSL